MATSYDEYIQKLKLIIEDITEKYQPHKDQCPQKEYYKIISEIAADIVFNKHAQDSEEFIFDKYHNVLELSRTILLPPEAVIEGKTHYSSLDCQLRNYLGERYLNANSIEEVDRAQKVLGALEIREVLFYDAPWAEYYPNEPEFIQAKLDDRFECGKLPLVYENGFESFILKRVEEYGFATMIEIFPEFRDLILGKRPPSPIPALRAPIRTKDEIKRSKIYDELMNAPIHPSLDMP